MALQAREAASFPVFAAISRRRPAQPLLGWLLLATVSVLLWGWFAMAVVAPLAQVHVPDGPGADAVARGERASVILVQAEPSQR